MSLVAVVWWWLWWFRALARNVCYLGREHALSETKFQFICNITFISAQAMDEQVILGLYHPDTLAADADGHTHYVRIMRPPYPRR